MKKRNHLTRVGLVCVAGVAAILLGGCKTTPEQRYVVTEITSEPTGARIEVNGNYVGEAPAQAELRTHADGVVKGKVVIRAIPTEEGNYVQEKVFRGPQYPFDPHRDQAPERVFFDMTLEPVAGTVRRGEQTRYKKSGETTDAEDAGSQGGTEVEQGDMGPSE